MILERKKFEIWFFGRLSNIFAKMGENVKWIIDLFKINQKKLNNDDNNLTIEEITSDTINNATLLSTLFMFINALIIFAVYKAIGKKLLKKLLSVF